jgi:hypothetical protein
MPRLIGYRDRESRSIADLSHVIYFPEVDGASFATITRRKFWLFDQKFELPISPGRAGADLWDVVLDFGAGQETNGKPSGLCHGRWLR